MSSPPRAQLLGQLGFGTRARALGRRAVRELPCDAGVTARRDDRRGQIVRSAGARRDTRRSTVRRIGLMGKASVGAAGAAAMAALLLPVGAHAAPSGIAPPKQFMPTGHQQVYIVPSGVQMVGLNLVGGFGGSVDPQVPLASQIGSYGASLEGYLATRPGEKLYVEVGQSGRAGGGATFGGGGAAGSPPPGVPDCTLAGSDKSVPCDGPWAGSGGGASDVRTCSELAPSCQGGGTSVGSRLIVAAGGGGEGGGGLVGDGAGCDNGVGGGTGENQQLPSASPSGPAVIVTGRGTVIPGFAGGNLSSVTKTDGSTNAAMGRTAPGAGGTSTGCTVNTISYAGSVAGSRGSGPDGGTGGNAGGLGPCCGGQHSFAPGAGGGGGGGYFGGGGGATGMGTCSPAPCGSGGAGGGGAAGSSFVSKEVKDPFFGFGSADVLIEFVPVMGIDRPADGAVYSPGQVVDAAWSCVNSVPGYLGVSNCTGTENPGSRIDTSPGRHTFTVKGNAASKGGPRETLTVSVTYTVKTGQG